jgi:hypothetical protein
MHATSSSNRRDSTSNFALHNSLGKSRQFQQVQAQSLPGKNGSAAKANELLIGFIPWKEHQRIGKLKETGQKKLLDCERTGKRKRLTKIQPGVAAKV